MIAHTIKGHNQQRLRKRGERRVSTTIHLYQDELEFLREYSHEKGISISMIINEYIETLMKKHEQQ